MDQLRADVALTPDVNAILPWLVGKRRLAARKPGWRVVRRCTLAMLNFRKLVMYRDLRPERRWGKWGPIEKHPIIQELLGYPASGADGGSRGGNGGGHDNAPASDPPLVTDADSSQLDAMRAAGRPGR